VNGSYLPEDQVGSLDSNQKAEVGTLPLLNAVCVESIQYVPPGQVTVSLLTQTDYKFIANNIVESYVGSRELIVIEMLR